MGNKNFQEIQEIGFASLIKKFTGYTGSVKKSVLKGIGDDASVLKSENGKVICTTTEIFLEGVHFDLTYTPFHHLGYKLVTAAVSDIYAMNASPEQLLVSIAIPNKYSVQMMEQLYKGIDAACKDYKIQLTGGDTTASHQVLSISVTCTGVAEEKDIVYRSGAKADDLICVTGDLGAALAGLRILMREKKEWKDNPDSNFQPELEDYEYVVQRQLVPGARKDYHDALRKSDVKIHALMDVTQGLVADLRSMANASGVGLTLYSPAVPISLNTRKVADEMKEDVDKYAFYGGEDFEMLFTISEPDVEKLKSDFDDFSVIGKVTDQDKLLKINTGEDQTIEIEL